MAAFSGSTHPRKTVFISALAIVIGINAMCPPPDNNWLKFGSSCYNFTGNNKNWVDAKALCQDRGAKLLVIESPEENDFIAAEMAKQSKPRVWIGCRYDDTAAQWLCLYADGYKEMTYSNWKREKLSAPAKCLAKYSGTEWYGVTCDIAALTLFTVCETTSIASDASRTAPRLATCLVMGADGRPTLT